MNECTRRTLTALDRIATATIFMTAISIAAVSAFAAEAPTSIAACIAPTTFVAARHLSESDRADATGRATAAATGGR